MPSPFLPLACGHPAVFTGGNAALLERWAFPKKGGIGAYV